MKREIICLGFSLFLVYTVLSVSSCMNYFALVLEKPHELNISLSSPLKNTSDENSSPKQISIKIKITPSPPLNSSETKICIFPEYNFTPNEELRIWNYTKYSNCKTESKDQVYIDKNELIANCQDNLKPDFAENLKLPEKLGGSRKSIPKWSPFAPDINSINFVFIRCGMKSIYSYIFLRYSESASKKAKSKEDNLRLTYNFTGNEKTSVMLLTFDSVSRDSAYRNLKNSIKYLKTKHEDFDVYEFVNPGIPETHTQDNMAQILYGDSKYKIQKKVGTRVPFGPSRAHTEYQKRAIWSHYSELGYVTMFLHDSVWDYLPGLIGRDVLADHVLANYWKMVWAVYGFHDHLDGQRCIGNQNSHNISFTYIYDFYNIYPDNNKFSYIHLDAAHETKGNIQTVDDDLLRLLKSLIKLFKSRNETFLILLIGDHGQKRSELQFDIRNKYEGDQSLTFFITSKHLNEYKETITYNTQYLFSRYDLHLTLKDFSLFPYSTHNENLYSEYKQYYEVQDVKSLIKEKINPYRKCEDLGVSSIHCPCSGYVQAGSDSDLDLLEDGFFPIILNILRTESAACLNQSQECNYEIFYYQKFILNSVDDGGEVLYDLKIGFNETEIIEIKIRGCTEAKIKETKNVIQGSRYQSINYVYERAKMFYQVYWVGVERV